jgi:hypothetical protein
LYDYATMVFAYESPWLQLGDWGKSGLSETADDEVLLDIGAELRDELADYITRPDFEARAVPSVLKSDLAGNGPAIMQRTLHREARMSGYRESLLTEHVRRSIGASALDPKELAESGAVVLGPRTITSLQEQFDELPYDFSELDAYHRTWQQTQALDLLLSVHRRSLEAHGAAVLADEAYSLIADATREPERYALPLDQPESLMLLCYAPHESRQLLRRFMRHNMILGLTERTVTDDPETDETDVQLLDALRRYHRADILHGDQWNRLGLSEPYRLATAHASIDGVQALADIQAITRSGGGKAARTAFRGATSQVWAALQRAGHDTQLTAWQNSDYGHTFGSYQYEALGMALDADASDQAREFARPVKDGRLAAILEDDPRQLVTWRQLVGTHTTYETTDALCSADPGVIVRLADHPPGSDGAVGLFMLDIQNDTDPMAGIRAAEQIIATRLSQVERAVAKGNRPPQTKIIIWSASGTAVAAANEWAKQVTDRLNAEYGKDMTTSLWRRNGSGWRGAAISCETRLKGWSELDTPLQRRK